MSKSNLCENRAAKRYNYVAGMLEAGKRQQGMSTEDIFKKTGIPIRTVNDRLQHPESIRLEDLYKLCDAVGVRIMFELKEIPE